MARDYTSALAAQINRIETDALRQIESGKADILEGERMLLIAKQMKATLADLTAGGGRRDGIAKAEKSTPPEAPKPTSDQPRSEHAQAYGSWKRLALDALERAVFNSGTVDDLVDVVIKEGLAPGKDRKFIKDKLTAALHTMARLQKPVVTATKNKEGRSFFSLVDANV